jgi:hypothetical protein
MHLRASLPASIAFAILIAPIRPICALAQTAGPEVALAEVLYEKGRQLMAEGKYAEACPKFAESYRLDAATGTLLNLASCHEGEHKFATAFLEFTEASAAAKQDHRDDRVKFAEERLAAIEPKVSRLAVEVARAGDIPDLKVQLDGVLLPVAARGVAAPVDPGDHVVEAHAPGRKPWNQSVHFGEEARSITVTVPLLDAEAPPASAGVAQPASAGVAQPASPAAAAPPPIPEAPVRPVPVSVYVAGGATVVLGIGAGVTGFEYMQTRSDPNTKTPERWGAANIALLGATLVGGGVTAYLYWTRPSTSPRAASMALSPWVVSSGGGVSVTGSL